MEEVKTAKEALIARAGRIRANVRLPRIVVKIALGLAVCVLILLSVQYLSDSPSVEQEGKEVSKYIHALGYEYLPQPKEESAWIPKLGPGKSRWSRGELETFSDESRKVLKNNYGLARHTIDPKSDSILILTPMKNSAAYISKYFELLDGLKYPRSKISLAFLVSDSTDDTQQRLIEAKRKYQEDGPIGTRFKRFDIHRQDFFYALPQNKRHMPRAQRDRRIVMARARNYLWTRALEDEQWVAWIDSDLASYPRTIMRDLMAYDKDVIVPNCLYAYKKNPPRYRVYDFNAWQETPESLAMIETLKEDDFLVEGYKNLKTHRKYLDKFEKNETLVPLDGVGGTFTLVKSHVHRSGVGFPTWVFQHQVETEGFAKLAKANGYGVFGLPHYNIYHIKN
ncbi:hypothetical protein LPJ60_001829 [Coemansia sp. RSA 2675]|nr:hypothetical protein LPJ60_001829 [Coemansia sp. RSA 2675]